MMFGLRNAGVLLAALFLVMIAGATAAQEDANADPHAIALQLTGEGKFLAGVKLLDDALEREADPHMRDMQSQSLAQIYAMAGDPEKALRVETESEPGAEPMVAVDVPPGLTRHDAIETIVAMARDRQIVILNEAHHVARDRAFGLALALALRKIGFEYFAAETFAGGDDFAIPTGYPTLHTGFYTREPLFADLVRQAMAVGYKPMNYEIDQQQRQEGVETCPDRVAGNIATKLADPRRNSGIRRERAQACNLIDHILAKDQDARIFIYVGYGHAKENTPELPNGQRRGVMAGILKAFTGIDPLTIDQTIATKWALATNRHQDFRSLYYALDKAGLIDGPSLFKTAGGDWLSSPDYQGKIDLTVFHPPQHFTNGRPDWLFAIPGRKRVEIERDLLPGGQRVLVQAFVAGETERPIALDQAIVEPGGTGPIPLALYAGDYRLQYQNERGDMVDLGPLTVPD